MMTLSNNSSFADTIAAISTPPGKGGVAIIRISGTQAKEICEKIFQPQGSASPISAPRRLIYGKIIHSDKAVDDGLCAFLPCPNSYTGEDTVEISCHGGVLITRTVLEAALIAGARAAEAGEFTKRAFINGRLSLTDADAIGMLLDAESESQIKLASSESRARLSAEIDGIGSTLTSLLSSIYARIDYPEEDLGEFTSEDTLQGLKKAKEALSSLIATYKTGRAIREGISCAIVGSPNAGKSTLYNLLTGEDSAIVTDIPGTTRDLLERKVALGKVMLQLADTAGIRSGSEDPIEEIGISRSRKRAEESELIFALFDGTRPLSDSDYEVIRMLGELRGVVLPIMTKAEATDGIELERTRKYLFDIFGRAISISAKDWPADAIMKLTAVAEGYFTDRKINIGGDAVVSSARQHSCLIRCLEYINSAISAYEAGLPQDVSSSDIELALGALSELDGRAVSEAVVADIFSKFCVGK